MNDMEKKLAEYKCDTNEAVCLKLGKSFIFTIKKNNLLLYNHVSNLKYIYPAEF